MSRLSQKLRRVRLGPLVTQFVRLAEKLLGSGTGVLKKKLVIDLVVSTLRRLKEADLPIPDNAEVVIDELIEQAVDLLNQGEFKDVEKEPEVVIAGATGETKDVPKRNRGGRPAGSKNKPKPAAAKPVPAEEFDDVEPVSVREEFDLTTLDLDDEDEE